MNINKWQFVSGINQIEAQKSAIIAKNTPELDKKYKALYELEKSRSRLMSDFIQSASGIHTSEPQSDFLGFLRPALCGSMLTLALLGFGFLIGANL